MGVGFGAFFCCGLWLGKEELLFGFCSSGREVKKVKNFISWRVFVNQ